MSTVTSMSDNSGRENFWNKPCEKDNLTKFREKNLNNKISNIIIRYTKK